MLLVNNFLDTELNKPHFLRDEMIFMHCSLQKIYSIGIFCAPVVSQFIVKVKRKIEKVIFLKVYNFSMSHHFSNVNVQVVQAVIA